MSTKPKEPGKKNSNVSTSSNKKIRAAKGEPRSEASESRPEGRARSAIPKVTLPKIDKKSGWRGFLIYAVLGIILFVFFAATSNPTERFMPVEPISTLISDITNQKIKRSKTLKLMVTGLTFRGVIVPITYPVRKRTNPFFRLSRLPKLILRRLQLQLRTILFQKLG